MGMTWEALADLGVRLPEVVRDIWFRTPALKVRGKSFVRLKEDGQSVVFLLESVDEQEFLIEARPTLYFITDHYRGYPAVLARLAALTPAECRLRLERAYRLKAPKALLKQLESAVTSAKARPKAKAARGRASPRAEKPRTSSKKGRSRAASSKEPQSRA